MAKETESTVPFSSLKQFNDSNSFVWTALTFNPQEKLEIEKFLKEAKFLKRNAKIVKMLHVVENIKGAAGRSDVLFVTKPTQFNPLARLKINGLKWTSDFIANFRRDYK